ncbi:MAG: aminotransferase class I/II-fold pyridoxal phosphate-dependent enzyme [Gammaproteobacteria bacterium]
MDQFSRMNRLPPYVFSVMEQLKLQVMAKGTDVFDFGIGNPDQPTPPHIVEALREAVLLPGVHRYAPSKGILELRKSICNWYGRRFNVDLSPESEAIVTIGSKEGLAHLALATMSAEDTVIVPNPCYPVHHFGNVIADANVLYVPLLPDVDFISTLESTLKDAWPKPKMLVINFPANPTTQCVDLDFFTKIIEIAKEHQLWVVHDMAYADIVFDGYRAPSILQVPGAKEIAVESYTLSKTYNMAGWRVGFMCGNAKLIQALARIKSYMDYGSFTPIQMAAIAALEGPQDCVTEICTMYQHRRDMMCKGLKTAGWDVSIPQATMFIWAKIPEQFRHLGSLEFAKLLVHQANVVMSPGIGFGEYGNEYVRIGLVENDQRMQEALKNISQFMRGEFDLPTPTFSSEYVSV